MKALLKHLLLLCLFAAPAFAQSMYYGQNAFGLTSPGAMRYGQYGYDNPAILATVKGMDLIFNWTTYNNKWDDRHKYQMQIALPGISFSAENDYFGKVGTYHYNLASGFGNEKLSFGAGYFWSNGNKARNLPSMWNLGAMFRPNQYLSTGLVVYLPEVGEKASLVDVAVRPFKNELVSVFGEYVYKEKYRTDESKYSAGVAIEALPGFRITGRYYDNKSMTAGVQLSLGHIGITSQAAYDENGDYAYNTYGVRLGSFDRNVFERFSPVKKYVQMDLIKGLDYTRFKLFDDKYTLMDVLTDLEALKNDPSVSGILINASGMDGNRELYWEIREKLKEVKNAGKEVVIYIDRAGIDEYHFASVANKIIMDPLGTVSIQGYLMGRTYFKGTLEKLGIGYDELRFFKYKSAVETFSRDKMSDADREQRQRITDDWYKLAKEDIVSTGRLTGDQFDTLANSKIFLMASEAVKMNMVDSLVRWDLLQDHFKNEKIMMTGNWDLLDNKKPTDNYWGVKPTVAVIYALGACDMETGIAARSLVKDVKAAVENPNVKAIVLRVDSPGGDAMASDYISDVLRRAKGKKPIIVSQGFVAGSGGYWLSMYSDTIVAAPSTITGSIGVIAGFFYDSGFKKSIGVSTDYVKKGKHADAGFGFVIPLLGLPIMDQPLNADQRGQVEGMMKSMYADFVNKVADGRNMKPEAIAEIAQGRVWSGYDGKKIGLVDELGGLEKAIAIAVEKAQLKKGEYEIVEYPEAKLLNAAMFTPSLFGVPVAKEDPALKDMQFRMKNNGRPLYVVPLDYDIK